MYRMQAAVLTTLGALCNTDALPLDVYNSASPIIAEDWFCQDVGGASLTFCGARSTLQTFGTQVPAQDGQLF